jgi:DnaJ-class molecular chaperone
MRLKKIEDMNLYEILNVDPSASLQEIRRAYGMCKTSYGPGALAYYGLLNENERQLILERIEEAYTTLGNIRRRKNYDSRILKNKTDYSENTYFRHSTDKMLIEDGDSSPNLWAKVKSFLFPKK